MKRVECPKCGEIGQANSECPGCGLLLDGVAADKNISGLNDHLFAQLERLSDPKLAGDRLSEEIERSKAVTSISKEIISGAKLQLDAVRTAKEYALQTTPGVLALDHKG